MAGNPGGRGIVFTMDAVFALLMIVAVLPLIEVIYVQNVSPYLVHEQLHLQSEDVSSVLVKITTGDELNESPVLQQLLAQGKIRQSDLDRPLIDTIGMFWAANTSEDLAIAQSIVFDAVGNVTPPGASWQAFFAEDEIAANSSPLNSSTYGTSASKRFISGFEKNKTLEGCTARAFLERAAGREEAKYGFFGGFTGQGNLTQKVMAVPSDANITYLYLEANFGDNFSLYVNGNFCSNFSKTAGNYSVDNFTVENASYPNCIGNLSKGADNVFYLNFTGNDSTKHYVGGGFVKVAYDTAQLSYSQPNAARYNFPGISGFINLYDSFYVPGNVSNITAYLNYYASESRVYLSVGNVTVFNRSGNESVQNFTIGNSTFASNFSDNYLALSGTTVPLRLSSEQLISQNATANVDVILVTDVSGTMTWRLDENSGSGANGSCTNCSDPCMNQSTVVRINKAKCLDKGFISEILNVSGNRVGLVSFSDDADSGFVNLTTNATLLEQEIDSYDAQGGKSQLCLCCAINRAYLLANATLNDSGINESIPRKKFIVMMANGIAGNVCGTGCQGNGTDGQNVCGGGAAACTSGSCECAAQNANYSSCRAAAELPSVVYSVGFGPVFNCLNANISLQNIANCGGGAYYYSSDAAEMQNIYAALAQAILNQSIVFSTQVANFSGTAANMTLYPDSYIDFAYSSSANPPQFRQISISAETDAFSGCNGSFFVPPADSIDEVKVTSYSEDYWTDRVDAKNSTNPWANAFNLSSYRPTYSLLGDPFVVYLNPNLFKANATNQVNVSTGANATDSSAQCSGKNKAFYSYRVTLPSVFSPVLANCTGRNVTVFFDKDGDGVADGNLNLSYGTVSDPVPVSPDALEPAANAADYAFLKLMDGLNFDNQTDSVSISTGRSATQANPIDLRIPSGSVVDTTPLSGIPFMWGPAELQVTMRT